MILKDSMGQSLTEANIVLSSLILMWDALPNKNITDVGCSINDYVVNSKINEYVLAPSLI